MDLLTFIFKKLQSSPTGRQLASENQLRLDRAGTNQALIGGMAVAKVSQKLTEGNRVLRVSSRHRMGGPRGETPTMVYPVRGIDDRRCDEAFFDEPCGKCGKCTNGLTPKKGPIVDRCDAPVKISVAVCAAQLELSRLQGCAHSRCAARVRLPSSGVVRTRVPEIPAEEARSAVREVRHDDGSNADSHPTRAVPDPPRPAPEGDRQRPPYR